MPVGRPRVTGTGPPSKSHGLSGREGAAGTQDARLSGDQAALRAGDPAGRLPEREDAVTLPLFVCPCQEGTVSFRSQPGVGVHGLPPFVRS